MGEETQEGSDRVPSLDAIYYDDDYPMAGRHGRKYKRKDYSSLVPLGGPRWSGRLRANRQHKMPSFVDLEVESE